MGDDLLAFTDKNGGYMVLFKNLSTAEKYMTRLKMATRKYEVIDNYICGN